MIFAQINPVASITQQTTPFVQTTVTGSYMTAIARPYALGSEKVNFQVNYGNVTFDESGSVVSFQQIFNDNVMLSGSAITNWGTNDAAILTAVAALQGTSVVAVVSGSINQF